MITSFLKRLIGARTATYAELQQPIQWPEGFSEESLFDYLNSFRLDGSESNELENYLREDFRRFVYTLNLLPDDSKGKRLLEIGANPYFTSILVRRFTNYELYTTNYFGHEISEGVQTQSSQMTNESFKFEFAHHNIEKTDIPFEIQFDTIIFCEVLEHLTNDPLAALLRIRDKLKAGGTLILSTPNVSRLENITRMIAGSNIYDPYSGYGPYGRHNREYNQHEVFQLLRHAGFTVETIFSSDVHPNHSNSHYSTDEVLQITSNIANRNNGLGQYIFVKATKNDEASSLKPAWLYRSYPEAELL